MKRSSMKKWLAICIAGMLAIPANLPSFAAEPGQAVTQEAEGETPTKPEEKPGQEAGAGANEGTGKTVCDKTEGCTLEGGHEGDCVVKDAEEATDAPTEGNTEGETDAEPSDTNQNPALFSLADGVTNGLNGSGTKESPYEIGNAEDLKFVAEKVNAGDVAYNKAVYKLTNHIELEGSKDNQWTPIGTSANKFAGTFIGTDYEIRGLYIDNTDLENAGLFGVIASPAKLVDITVKGATVHAKSNVGAIAGSAFTGTVENCKVTGKIDISGNYKVGGMFDGGYVSITNSSVEAEEGSTVTGVYKASDLEGDNVGGLIGFRGEGTSPTTGCSVSNVTVAGTRKVGGLIGSVFTNNKVEDCKVSNVKVACNASKEYGTSILNSSAMAIGGMLGLYTANGNNDGTLKNCTVENITLTVENEELAAANKVTMGYVSGGQRYNTAPAATIAVENITVTGTNSGSNAEEKFPGSVAMNGEQKLFANGTGTEADPYIIASVDELKLLANTVNGTGITYEGKYFKAADNTVFDLSSEQWKSIGTSSKKFMGTFDGNGATVKGLTDQGKFGCYGLFGYISGATIKNLVFTDVNMTYNGSNRGAVAGHLYGTNTIENVEVSGKVAGADYVGGIAGRPYLNDSNLGTLTISNCVNNAVIEGSKKVGGIVGYARADVAGTTKAVVNNCKNNGEVSGDYAGGIAGWAYNAELKDCSNTGKVTGKISAGGIVGNTNQNSVVIKAVNSGVIEGDKAGGIIGVSNSGGAIVSQSANTGKITGVQSAGGIIGGTAAAGDSIDNCYNGGDITATGNGAIAAGIYGYNNSTSPIKACMNDGKITAPDGKTFPIGKSTFWYAPAPGSQIASCYYMDETGKIYAVAADGEKPSVEQPDMTRTELAETLNAAGGVNDFWQAQNGSVQLDPLIPGALEDAKRVALIKDKDGNEVEGYTSLEAAAEAVKDGQTIVLEKDITLDATLVIKGDKEVTLDLNGKTLTLKEGVKAPVLEVGDKTTGTDKTSLTLTDTAEKKGVLKSGASAAAVCVRTGASMVTENVKISFEDTDDSAANIAVQVQGELTVKDGTKIDSTEYGVGAVAGSKVVIKGGEITAKESAVGGNGTWHDTEIIVEGGTLTSTGSAGIYHPQRGKLTLKGGTIKGLTGVQMCAGELDIPADSTVKVIATSKDERGDKGAGDGPINDGAAIFIVDRDYPGGVPTAAIKGGTFVAEQTKNAVLAYTWDASAADGDKHSKWDEAGEHVAISGGIYNSPIAKELLADGFALNAPDKNGNYGVHKHQMTKVDKKDATCTETGVSKTYYKCGICGKYFADELGAAEITDVDGLVIPAKGHNYVDGKCTVCGASSGSKPENNPGSNSGGGSGSSSGGSTANKPHVQAVQGAKTGDSAHVELWIAVLAIAAGTAVVVSVYAKRRKSK